MPSKRGTGASSGTAPTGNKMTGSAAARIQSTQAKSGNDTGKGSFPARAQSGAARNAAGGAGAGAAAGGAKAPKSK
ncbi:hypothetical protein JAAARDRAFT_52099 [Jaapia argillacea MUCL 33604]|uniref:SMP domain-containing protein n=1 Tax=Jaapia argillacea MUCL 33604 TaxID=933084 RepID=A0A067QD55_9AGAM|nr:hypothetical protein JAAARDRAFT_52099 [Jaapia argillacea MUCL 33604]